MDGELLTEHLTISWIEYMESLGPFGRGFDQPLFMGIFQVVSVRIVGQDQTHLSLRLRFEGRELQAIWFSALESSEPELLQSGDRIKCIYNLTINTYRGQDVSLTIRYAELEQKGNPDAYRDSRPV